MPKPASLVVEFATRLDAVCFETLGDELVATYLHGSAALGGFVEGRSDVDMLFITRGPIGEDVLDEVADALRAAATRCPGRGVELSVVSAATARRAAAPWPFLLHLSTDPDDAKVIFGTRHGGDPDLLMHFVACRASGFVVRGPAPDELIGPIDRGDVLAHLDRELVWAIQNAHEAYLVLNACRAIEYLERGEIVSKIDGARYMLRHGGPEDLIAEALAMQVGDQPHRPPSERARAFVAGIRVALQQARE
jgi:Domain of unknown function (DUF4111)